MIEDLAERVFQTEKSLENWRQYLESQNFEIQIHEMKQQIDCLFLSLKGIEGKVNLATSCRPTKPHKCPICEGVGKKLTEAAKVNFDGMLRAGLEMSAQCHACEGLGIVWG